MTQDTGKLPGGGNYEGPAIHTLTVFANPFIEVLPIKLSVKPFKCCPIASTISPGRSLHLRGGGSGCESRRGSPH